MNNATLNSATLDGLGASSGFTPAVAGEINCSVSVSDYAWLTPSLINIQKQFALRPYYTCQIIDDNVVYKSDNQLSSPVAGSSVLAPDGSILVVGLDESNNVGFWKVTDPSNVSQWEGPATTILESTLANIDSRNNYTIECSDYIAGQYKIDVYFFGNFNGGSGAYLTIKHYYSLNSGVTWFSNQTVNTTVIPYGSISSRNINIAAGKPYQDNSGAIISTVFYLEPNGNYYDIAYQQYSGSGTTFDTEVRWSSRDINTDEWVLHSIAVEFVKGYYYIAFSGYHAFYEPVNQSDIENFNMYITRINQFTNNADTDLWTQAIPIIEANSTSPQNPNSFVFPCLNYIESDESLQIAFLGDVLTSITNDTLFSTVISRDIYVANSKDYFNFSYPVPVTSEGDSIQSFNPRSILKKGVDFYVFGDFLNVRCVLIALKQNNIVADVSLDVLSYKIIDNQQGAGTLQITIGNANNKWFAGTPSTENGYQAISRNNKINIFQGYYNLDSGIPEVAPKDIFYIDDIQQTVNSSRNDFTISARNLYKNLKTLTTKFTYNFEGMRSYTDIFDGSTNQNYNFVSGNWSIDPTTNRLIQSQTTDDSSRDFIALFSLYEQVNPNTIFSVCAQLGQNFPPLEYVDFYLYYVDTDNWIRLRTINLPGNYQSIVQKKVAGIETSLTQTDFDFGLENNVFPFLFIRHDYYTYDMYVGSDIENGQGIDAFNTPVYLGSIDFSGFFDEVGVVGFGNTCFETYFQNFKYFEFDQSQNIEELVKTLATKAGIFDFVMPTVFEEYFFTDSNFTGTFTTPHRTLTIQEGDTAVRNNEILGSVEVKFDASVEPESSDNFGFDFIFKDNNAGQKYIMRFATEDVGDRYMSVKMYFSDMGTEYLLSGTGNLAGDYDNNLLIDIQNKHTYRIVIQGYFVFVIVDDVVVFSWFETSSNYYSQDGYIGFTANNGILRVQNIVGTGLFDQIESYSFNPGDDLEGSLDAITSTVLNYYFSDNFGRLKVKKMEADEDSSYTYQDQMILNTVDNSDKEYVNQIVVNGLNVTATVRDDASIATTGAVREAVINDYKITTYTAALARAHAEMISFNKFNNQYNPKQAINVGSQLYDVVRVVNTGANSSNVDEDVRVYSQEFEVGGNNAGYWLQVETGKL